MKERVLVQGRIRADDGRRQVRSTGYQRRRPSRRRVALPPTCTDVMAPAAHRRCVVILLRRPISNPCSATTATAPSREALPASIPHRHSNDANAPLVVPDAASSGAPTP